MLNILEHKNILLQILKDIYSDTSISPFLGFKGGTAACLFYGLSRFSVDLDFDLLDEAKEGVVFSRIEEIAKNYGKLKEARKKRFNLFVLLSYEEESQNIKIEVNRRAFGSQYELKTYLGISMLVIKKEDMFAHKLMAMYERIGKTSRDIYDVWFFLKNNWSINKKIVEERSGMTFKEVLAKCITALEKKENRNILLGMGELLDGKTKNWVKENLKKDALFLLKLKLEEEQF
ncbi:MAG: nucleotidyl transferase AbiEii/AbiGii toxin family protein [bacterium]|nr:nucleotidyl transferase AbiEii/AbiGii toxin family protein [bacterium]